MRSSISTLAKDPGGFHAPPTQPPPPPLRRPGSSGVRVQENSTIHLRHVRAKIDLRQVRPKYVVDKARSPGSASELLRPQSMPSSKGSASSLAGRHLVDVPHASQLCLREQEQLRNAAVRFGKKDTACYLEAIRTPLPRLDARPMKAFQADWKEEKVRKVEREEKVDFMDYFSVNKLVEGEVEESEKPQKVFTNAPDQKKRTQKRHFPHKHCKYDCVM